MGNSTIRIKHYELPPWVDAMYFESQHNPDPLERELAYRAITAYIPYIRFNATHTKNRSPIHE